jgi:hypothetical protein
VGGQNGNALKRLISILKLVWTMNRWVQKSIELASGEGYLDRLHEVYPVEQPEFRQIESSLMQQIVTSYSGKDPVDLVSTLLRLDKFPTDDPYIGFFRYDGNAIDRNRATVERIGNWLLSLRLDQILTMSVQPKRAVKQYGEAFKRWWLAQPYAKARDSAFGTEALSQNQVVIHSGTPEEWKLFANSTLGCGLVKNPDLLAKKGRRYLIGEAKFLTSFGGGQNDFFDEAIAFARQVHGEAHRIAVLDGPLWLSTRNRQSREVRRLQTDAMSALLLQEYLNEF